VFPSLDSLQHSQSLGRYCETLSEEIYCNQAELKFRSARGLHTSRALPNNGLSFSNTKLCPIPFPPRCLQECHIHVRDTLQPFASSPIGRQWSISPSSMHQDVLDSAQGYVLVCFFKQCTLTAHWTRRCKDRSWPMWFTALSLTIPYPQIYGAGEGRLD